MTSIALPAAELGRMAAQAAASARERLRPAWDPLRFGIFLLTLLTISRIHQRYAWLALARPMLIMVGVCVMYAIANPRSLSADSVLKTWPMRMVAAIAVLSCLSIPFGISMGNSGKFMLETYSRTLVFAVLLALSIRSSRDLYLMMWSFAGAIGILCWLSMFAFQVTRYEAYDRLADLYTYDANDVALVVLSGVGISMLLLQVAGRAGKIFLVAVLIGCGGTIARSGSRGALVGTICVGVFLLFAARGVSLVRRLVVVVSVGAALFYFAPRGYWKQMQTMLKPEGDYNWTTADGRKEVMERGFGYMVDYPVFGLGLANFEKAECTISEKAKKRRVGTGLRCTSPHNTYVQVGAELGVIGFGLWVAIMFRGIFGNLILARRLPKRWRSGNKEERLLAMAPIYLAVSTVGFASASFFLSFAWMDLMYVLLAFMAGLQTAIAVKLRADRAAGSVAGRVEPIPAPTSWARLPILAPGRQPVSA